MVAPDVRPKSCWILVDLGPGLPIFVATRGVDWILVFLDCFGVTCFFADVDMMVFPVLEPKIGAPTTQSPQIAGYC